MTGRSGSISVSPRASAAQTRGPRAGPQAEAGFCFCSRAERTHSLQTSRPRVLLRAPWVTAVFVRTRPPSAETMPPSFRTVCSAAAWPDPEPSGYSASWARLYHPVSMLDWFFVLAVARADALGSVSARSFAALVRNDVMRACWRYDGQERIDLRVTPGKQSADPGPTRRAACGGRCLLCGRAARTFSLQTSRPRVLLRAPGVTAVSFSRVTILTKAGG